MKKLVMFDMDGVLFDTMPRHAQAWKRLTVELGLDIPELEFYLQEGRNGRGVIETLLGLDADPESLYARKKAYFNAMPEGGLIPGARDVVSHIREKGLDAIVVTGSGQQKSFDRISREYAGLFRTEWMVTGNDVRHGKPDPEPYLTGLWKAGVNPDDAIVIENAPLGVKAGKAAGCFVIAVNTGPLPDRCLFDAGADAVYPDMTALLADIDRYL